MGFHRCGDNPHRLDYSQVSNGRIDCTGCEWGWHLTKMGWKRINRREEIA